MKFISNIIFSLTLLGDPSCERNAVEIYVAKNGDDNAAGMLEEPLKTIKSQGPESLNDIVNSIFTLKVA
ncbi:MAG: hypothetical protein ACI9FN_000082 [Saprospiraceae bacterium]|jgi:hypothetical protein